MTIPEKRVFDQIVSEAKSVNLKHNPLCAKLVVTPEPQSDDDLRDWLALANKASLEEMRTENSRNRNSGLKFLARSVGALSR